MSLFDITTRNINNLFDLMQTFAGLCGALMIGFGIVGAGAAGTYIDRTKKFEEVMKLGFAGAAISAVAFALVSNLMRYYNIALFFRE